MSPGQTLPGWYGKLPGMGDFAHRRLPAAFREGWDDWLQEGLAGLRERHAHDWVAHYLNSPLWCFALGAGTVDGQAWMGVLMPSVDGAGRYFPLTLARAFDPCAAAWWPWAVEVALQALDGDFDAARLEQLLAARCEPAATHETGVAVSSPSPLVEEGLEKGECLPPAPGLSLWRSDLADGAALRFTGLPRGASFDALLGWPPRAPAQACVQECGDA